MPPVPKSRGSCLFPAILGNGAKSVVVSSISITQGTCPRINGILGRKARLMFDGSDNCVEMDRERTNLTRSANVAPFATEFRDRLISDLRRGANVLMAKWLLETNSYPGGAI